MKISSTFLRLILIVISFLIVLQTNGIRHSNVVAFTSLMIMVLSIDGLISLQYPFSLSKVFYLFSFFFFGLSPYVQFVKVGTFFGSTTLKENDYITTNIIVIIILLLFRVFYIFFHKKDINIKIKNFINKFEFNTKKATFSTIIKFTLLISISFFLVYYLNNFDIISMLIRGGEYKETLSLSSSTALIITKFIQPIPVIILLYYLKIKKKNIILLFFLFVGSLIVASPVGIPRFAAAALYMPLFLFHPIFLRKNIFVIFFTLSLLIVFPFLNHFRYFSTDSQLNFGLSYDMFNTGAFDSYQNFALILNNDLTTNGRQLLGVIFFWIPRTIWPDKPIGSGAYIAEKLGFIFSNVSANYFAEGFINFGFIGIFIFLILISYFAARIDRIYWTILSNRSDNFLQITYLMSLGLLFFILRGDLLSSFAFSLGFIFSSFFVFYFVKR